MDELVDEPFRQAGAAVVDSLRALPDVDRCAEIEILGASPGVVVHVRLADGRSTVRRVAAPGALRSTLEALVTIPPLLATDREPDKRRSAPPPPTAEPSPAAPEPAPKPPSPSPRAHSIHAELGLEASLHASAAPVFLGYGFVARAALVVDAWVFQVPARWDIDDREIGAAMPSGFNMQSFLLGATAGRRFSTRHVVIDVTLGPHVVFENQEAYGPGEEGVGGAFGDMSIATWLRIAWPRAATWRASASLCIEAYPRRVGRVVTADEALPPLPAWGLTASFGASYEAL